MFNIKKPGQLLAYLLTAALVVAIIAAIIYFLVRDDNDRSPLDKGAALGAVVTNGYDCARIGGKILEKNGSAVDAAIAALFCEGISMPQSMGLGGGFLMTVYTRATGAVVTLNARETAPGAATEDMFDGDGSLASRGGLAAAVPGELKGYWEAHRRFGKLPWRELVEPTIELCNKGVIVTNFLDGLFKSQFNTLYADEFLRDTFIDPATNSTYLEGQFVKMPRLARALEVIAEEGADALYKGSLTRDFVLDIKAKGGKITEADMNNYQVEWQEPIKVDLPFKQVMYTAPLPGSGVVLGFMMNILKNFLDFSQGESVANWQKIIESFKFGYGSRTKLGDMNFVDVRDLVSNLTSPNYAVGIQNQIFDDKTFQDPEYYGANTVQTEDHGTAHISVLAPNGDAVAVTSTINLIFGAGFMSNSTGIILNDEMDDFSSHNITNSFDLPPSPSNFIRPGKRPLSSMVPSVILNEEGDAVLVTGAAGGSKITTSVAQVIIRNLWFNTTIAESISTKRIHHQLFPMRVSLEHPFGNDTDFVNAIHSIGHEVEIAERSSGFSAVTAISREQGIIRAASDKRRSGSIYFIF